MNHDEGQPAWLPKSSSGNQNQPLNSNTINSNTPNSSMIPAANTSTTIGTDNAAPRFKKPVKGLFTVINIGLMGMMSLTGALAIKNVQSFTDASTIIVGLYMILFAAMLAIFEIIQIYPIRFFDAFYKRNFGFLYGLMGKSGFTVFMAILSFAITNPQSLALATGITKQQCFYLFFVFII